ncbi:MAG: GNAT family N-acetyltransferase [Promethearchaeota archaeon]
MHNIDIIEEINENNLYLRKISKDDIEFFHQSLQDKEMIEFLSLGPLISKDHAKRLIKGHLEYWEKWLQFNYIIELREEKTIIKLGSISLWNISWLHRRAEIGVWIIPNFWKQGFAERALNLLKTIAYVHLKLNRLEAHVAAENKRSLLLFNKCGFEEEGLLKQYLNLNGLYHDTYILACLKPQLFKK